MTMDNRKWIHGTPRLLSCDGPPNTISFPHRRSIDATIRSILYSRSYSSCNNAAVSSHVPMNTTRSSIIHDTISFSYIHTVLLMPTVQCPGTQRQCWATNNFDGPMISHLRPLDKCPSIQRTSTYNNVHTCWHKQTIVVQRHADMYTTIPKHGIICMCGPRSTHRKSATFRPTLLI